MRRPSERLSLGTGCWWQVSTRTLAYYEHLRAECRITTLKAEESLNVEMRNEKMVGAKEQYSLGCHDFKFFLGFFKVQDNFPSHAFLGEEMFGVTLC